MRRQTVLGPGEIVAEIMLLAAQGLRISYRKEKAAEATINHAKPLLYNDYHIPPVHGMIEE